VSASFTLRGFRKVALGLAASLIVGLLPGAASAQWGLTRMRGDMSSAMRTGMRSGMRTGMRSGMRSGMRASMTDDAEPAGRQGRDRTSVLIQRYTRILRGDPRETFAFQRLMDLYRERDGNVDTLARELSEQIAADEEAFAPRMLLGHVYKAQNRSDEAQQLYQQAATLRPDEPAPQLSLARIALSNGDRASARQAFDAALEHTREQQAQREILRELGAIALDAEDFDAAQEYYERLARGAGTSIYLRTEFARALGERNHHERAITEYRRVIASMRGDNRVLPPILKDLGQALLDAGETDEAVETLNRALRLAGRSSGVRREIYDVIVEAYRRSDRLPELAERLAEDGRRDFDAVELLGRIHDELGNEDEALEAYRRALRLNARHIDTRVRIVQLLSRSGRIEDVIGEYRELVRVAPREPRFVVELAQLLMQVGRREEALRLADETSRRHARDAGVHQALAELFARWGEDDRATREIGILVRIDPRDPGHLIALGEQQLDEGDEQAALATWRRILAVDSDRGRAHATLGGVLADHDLLDLAEEHYRRAVEADEERIEYVRGLANVLERPRQGERADQRRERDAEAVRWWSRVLEVTEDRAARREARQRIVGIWSRRGELAARMGEWQRAMQAQPPDADAGRFLAEAYLRQRPRDVARAESTLERVVALEPGDVESLLALERVRTARGDLPAAIEVLRRLVEADPRRAPRYLQRMAEHAHALYRDEDAIEFAAEAVQRTPDDAEGHRRLGDLYRARQDMDRAIASYRRAIELNDRLFATYFDLAELHLARGEHEEGDRLYRGVLRSCPDDDLVARAGRASIQIHLGAGTLEDLERDLLPLALGQPRRPIFRKLVVELYDSLTAPMIQAAAGRGAEAREAREELDRLGTRAIKPLLEALADPDPAQKRIAVDVLGHLGNENAAGPLLAMAEGEAPVELRARALAGAGAVADPSLAPRFATLASGHERRLRGVAAWGLARIAAGPAVPAMRELLGQGDPTVRAYAALGLGRADERRSLDRLERLLREDRSPYVQAAAAWSLGRLGGAEHVNVLVAALRGRGGLVSRAATEALGRIVGAQEGGAEEARGALAEALFDPDPVLRESAAAALAAVDQDDVRFPVPSGTEIAGYLALLLDPGHESAPADLGPLRTALASAASDALHGPVERVLTALEVLAPIGSAPVGLGPLTATIESWPEAERSAAQRELAALAQGLTADLVGAMSHPEPGVREAAARRLALLDGDAAAGALVDALQDDAPSVQRAALAALGRPHRDHAGLVDRVGRIASSHGDWSARLRAVETLGRLGDPAAAAVLEGRLRGDDYAFVREAAATALGTLETSDAVLRAAAEGDPEARVRAAARAALP